MVFFQSKNCLLHAGLFFLTLAVGHAQQLEMKYAEFKDNKLVLHYTLGDSVVGRFFTVRLYSSRDNFLNPMEMVTGDVGLEVKPGPDNVIVWDAKEELGPLFNDKVSLEIRGRVFIPFINTESINQYKVFKRQRKYNITWTGGTPQNILNFDLYNGERKVYTFPNVANVGNYSFQFPAHIKPKKNYQFRISDSKNKEDVVYTNKFRIKRKVPLLLKAVPVLVAGYVAFTLQGDNATDDSIADPKTPD